MKPPFTVGPRSARLGSRSLRVASLFAALAAVTPAITRAAEEGVPVLLARSVVPNVPISLDDCRRLALKNNLVLRAERESMAAAGYLRAAELGAFEPDFVSSVSREYNLRKNTLERQISQGYVGLFGENNKLASIGLEGLLPTGMKYNFGYSVHDLKNNLKLVPSDPIKRQFQAFMGVALTQPLLKDFGRSATYAHIKLAKEDEAIARQEFRRQMLVVVGSVESVYWDLYVAQERLKLRLASVAAAEKLLAGNRDRVREGKMAEIELVEAQAGLAQRRSAASESQQQVVEISGRLRTLFAEPIDSDNYVLSTSDAPPAAGAVPTVEDALRDSVMLHPEYLTRVHRVEQEKVRISYAKNQRWPQVDLKASLGKNGLGTGFASSWREMDRKDYVSWTIGVEVRVPILTGTRAANTLRASLAHGREALLNLKAAEVEIANNIFSAAKKVESLQIVAASYDEVSSAAERLFKNEQNRLVEGKTDSRRLLEVENQFSDARVAALERRGEYEKARVEFEMASGRLLKLRGVDYVEPVEKKRFGPDFLYYARDNEDHDDR